MGWQEVGENVGVVASGGAGWRWWWLELRLDLLP